MPAPADEPFTPALERGEAQGDHVCLALRFPSPIGEGFLVSSQKGFPMRRRFSLLFALLTIFVATPSFAAESTPAAQSALAWLTVRQQADGSFPGFGAGSSTDAVFAYAAANIDPNGVLKNGNSPITALGNEAAAYAASSTAAAGKLTLAVVAADKDPRSFGGVDLVAIIQSGYHRSTGIYGLNPTDHAFALLALVSAGQPVPPAALSAARRLQHSDGGWSFDGGAKTSSDTNTTSLMLQGLVAAGDHGVAFTKALAYLKSQQNSDGGFPYSKESPFGSDSDANSTALSIQALVAAGEDPHTLRQSAGDPIDALLGFQNPSGAFRYQAALPDDNDLATAQAIPALLLKPFPFKRLTPAVIPAALPNTGGEPIGANLAILAATLLIAGFVLRKRTVS